MERIPYELEGRSKTLMTVESLAKKLRTPRQVQRFLRTLPYNRETTGETLRSPREALKAGTVHCLEAAMVAAAILEKHGYPPKVLSLESVDNLDHVVFVFQEAGKWGSIGRSRDEGLHGRAPVFKTPLALVKSYFEPFVDKTGRIEGWGIADLDGSQCPWRDSPRHVWKVERYLIDFPHRRVRMGETHYSRAYAHYLRRGSQPRRAHRW